MTRASAVSIERKSRRSVSRAISASAPASSTPVGPPPTMTNVSHSARRARVVLALGRLEGDQDPPPDLERVVDGLEAGRVAAHSSWPKYEIPGAGGDDEGVVGDLPAVGQRDLALPVDPDRLAEEHRGVAAAAQDRAERLRRCRPGERAPVATW